MWVKGEQIRCQPQVGSIFIYFFSSLSLHRCVWLHNKLDCPWGSGEAGTNLWLELWLNGEQGALDIYCLNLESRASMFRKMRGYLAEMIEISFVSVLVAAISHQVKVFYFRTDFTPSTELHLKDLQNFNRPRGDCENKENGWRIQIWVTSREICKFIWLVPKEEI